MQTQLEKEIRKQQEGKEGRPEFMIGEQLIEMARGDDNIAEILLKDLQNDGMNLVAAEKQLSTYAKKNKGKDNFFCITPKVAEDILRKFYSLPEKSETKSEASPLIDISDFI